MPQLRNDEPVLLTSLAGSGVAYVLGLLVTHGVITDVQASATTQQVVPLIASALVLALGWVARRFVTPAAKVKTLLEREGLLTDADWSRLELLVHDELGIDLDAPDAHPTDTPAPGMDAGAPA